MWKNSCIIIFIERKIVYFILHVYLDAALRKYVDFTGLKFWNHDFMMS